MSLSQPDICENGHCLTLQAPDGTRRFHAIWLRDNAGSFIEPISQKKATILDIPARVSISHASSDNNTLTVTLEPAWTDRV